MRKAVLAVFLTACGGDGQPAPEASSEGAEATHSVLNGPGSATHPAVSPDGTRLAFMSNAPGVLVEMAINFEIFVSTVDGLGPERLTDNQVFDADIAWSPDGRRIAFKSYRDGNDEIYVMDADGSDPVNLTKSEYSESQPHWSPDGTLLLFGSNRSGQSDIFVMNSDGSGVRSIAPTPHSDSSPRWSPDGRRIAFVSDRDGNDDVYLMELEGSNVRRLTSSPESDWSPRWSPDGNTLLFISGNFSEDRWSLFSLMVDEDSGPEMVVEGVDSGNPAWHPSSERIFFGRYVDGESRLYSSRPDGSDIRPLRGY